MKRWECRGEGPFPSPMKILTVSDKIVESIYSPAIEEWFGDVDLVTDLSLTYTVEGAGGIYQANIVVPEPATLMMLAAGLLGLALWQRAKKRKA